VPDWTRITLVGTPALKRVDLEIPRRSGGDVGARKPSRVLLRPQGPGRRKTRVVKVAWNEAPNATVKATPAVFSTVGEAAEINRATAVGRLRYDSRARADAVLSLLVLLIPAWLAFTTLTHSPGWAKIVSGVLPLAVAVLGLFLKRRA
jgi:hypothetical protein